MSHLSQLVDAPFDEIIDVRAPSEYAQDHVPGAINLPVLDDAQRAEVGTLYKQDSPFIARKRGAALIARNAARHIEEHFIGKDGGYIPLVYCWRGGMRSGALATILSQIGWRVQTLEGGYKTYRRLVVRALYEPGKGGAPWAGSIVLLDGYTGTAKTELLHRLADKGVQMIDLEGLSHHRGSLFGARGGGQPSQKLFETAIAARLARFDPARPILIEAESSKIGTLSLPQSLWQAMTAAPRIRMSAALPARAEYLCRTYTDLATDSGRLLTILDKLRPYHAGDLVNEWIELAQSGDLTTLASELMTHHYDRAYARQRRRADLVVRAEIHLSGMGDTDLDAAALQIIAALEA